jgi:hypothetical protein
MESLDAPVSPLKPYKPHDCHGCPTCDLVHKWDARVYDLTQYGDNLVCPSCESRGRKGAFCRGCTSIAADKRLTAEWHEDNLPPPAEVLGRGGEKHKWRFSNADCGHVWESSPVKRSSNDGCPECYRKVRGKVVGGYLECGGCRSSYLECGGCRSKSKACMCCSNFSLSGISQLLSEE